MYTEIRKQITDEILRTLEQGLVPWQKPWLRHQNDGPPRNVLTNLSFRGSNFNLLQQVAHRQGFMSRWWGTEKVWNAFGYQVKPHQEGTQVFYGTSQNQTVFNAEQAEGAGVERYLVPEATQTHHPAFDVADKIIAATKADIRHIHGDEATYYHPPKDYIVVPLKSQFVNGPRGLLGYYATLFHELVHHSAHRLGWLAAHHLTTTERYALGELRSELGAAFLVTEIGIPRDSILTSHAMYIGHWMKVMNDDPAVIMRVASAASEAADFILSFFQQQQKQTV